MHATRDGNSIVIYLKNEDSRLIELAHNGNIRAILNYFGHGDFIPTKVTTIQNYEYDLIIICEKR